MRLRLRRQKLHIFRSASDPNPACSKGAQAGNPAVLRKTPLTGVLLTGSDCAPLMCCVLTKTVEAYFGSGLDCKPAKSFLTFM